jgi:hypothetical protein
MPKAKHVKVTLEFTVEVEPHGYQPTSAEVAADVLDSAHYYAGSWENSPEVEPETYSGLDDWRGYWWHVAGVAASGEAAATTPCKGCGKLVDVHAGSGRQPEYCSNACRQRAYRARRK